MAICDYVFVQMIKVVRIALQLQLLLARTVSLRSRYSSALLDSMEFFNGLVRDIMVD